MKKVFSSLLVAATASAAVVKTEKYELGVDVSEYNSSWLIVDDVERTEWTFLLEQLDDHSITKTVTLQYTLKSDQTLIFEVNGWEGEIIGCELLNGTKDYECTRGMYDHTALTVNMFRHTGKPTASSSSADLFADAAPPGECAKLADFTWATQARSNVDDSGACANNEAPAIGFSYDAVGKKKFSVQRIETIGPLSDAAAANQVMSNFKTDAASFIGGVSIY